MSRGLPIRFNTGMVQAILNGRKTVTRRIMKPQPLFYTGRKYIFADDKCPPKWEQCDNIIETYQYQPGDILYVQEPWFYECHMEDKTAGKPDLPSGRYLHRYIYKVDNPDYPVNAGVGGNGWQQPKAMPKEVARIWLKVEDVRVERLQDMTLDDFLAEGANPNPEAFNDPENAYGQAKSIFTEIWNSTIKKQDQDLYSWDANPWVWVIEFERCGKPESEG